MSVLRNVVLLPGLRSNFTSREFDSRERFRFLVITRHQEVGFRRTFGRILPTDLADLSKPSGTSTKTIKTKCRETKHPKKIKQNIHDY